MPTPSPRTDGDIPAQLDTPPVPLRPRHNGWTAERQRQFLTALAESGSVTQAAAEVGLSARSAYRLRAREDARSFAGGWDAALRIATGRLTALAFERATTGRVRQTWKDGELVATTREPSDRLLMFLLHTLHDRRYNGTVADQRELAATSAHHRLPAFLPRLTDNDCPTEFIQAEDLAGGSLLPPAAEAEPFE